MNAYTGPGGPFGGRLVFRPMGGGAQAIRRRHAGPCGPYQTDGVRRAETADGIGGYLRDLGAFGGLELSEGAGVRLRVKDANEWEIGRLRNVTGYWTDDAGSGDSIGPFVALLPHERGYLAGWGYGPGMAAGFSRQVYTDSTDAARAAHREAERAAEAQREHEAEERARMAQEERAEARAQAQAARRARAEVARARRCRARRPDVLRAWRASLRLMVEPSAGNDYMRGVDLQHALRTQLQRTPAYLGGPWQNLSRQWAAWHLRRAGELRREYLGHVATATTGGRWDWMLTHVRDNVRSAHSCNRTADYRGLPA